jgi:hypothetical protein
MPITYERDDQRRLITVRVSESYSVDDILSAIDRQAAEDTWEYAMLYDLRAAMHLSTEGEAQQLADRVKAVGGGRERGSLGIAVGARPEGVRMGLRYTELTRKLVNVEMLLTTSQVDDWLARNARRGSSLQP